MLKNAGSILIVVFFAASLYFLNYVGVSSRSHGEAYAIEKGVPFRLMQNSTDIYSLWKERDEHGRVIVHVGKYLHFIELQGAVLYDSSRGFPVETVNPVSVYEEKLGDENLLWMAIQSGIAREIYDIVPPPLFQERVQSVSSGDDQSGIKITKDSIVTHFWGSRRTITSLIPELREPVLLHIDATYFSDGEPAALMELLSESGIRADLVTLGLAMDNQHATDADRERLREFAAMLGGER